MDWQARDRGLAEKIREIVIRSPEPLTRGKLLAELGIGNILRRTDDEGFVLNLRDDLVRNDVNVWFYLKAMESRGRTFLQEIRDAIERSERVLAIIGPMALKSEYVRSEWEHALLYRYFVKESFKVHKILTL